MAEPVVVKTVKIEATGLRALQAELEDVKDAMVDATDPTSMKELAAEAGRLTDQIEDANKEIENFRGSDFSQMSSRLGQVGSSLASLDFQKAAKEAKALQVMSSKISFKSAISSVKALGKTFLSLGKALLTNPLFLLATIITAIVIVIYKFLDSIGFIKAALDVLGNIIGWVIQLFKDLTDWLGLTNNAGKKMAQEKADAIEEGARREVEAGNSIISSLDHEIRVRKLLGQDVQELLVQRAEQQQHNAEKEYEIAQSSYAAAREIGEASKEDLDTLKKTADTAHDAIIKAINEVTYVKLQAIVEERKAKEKALQDAQDAEEKALQDAQKRADEWRAIAEKEAADRLRIKRTIEDLELEMVDDNLEKSLRANDLKYARLVEDADGEIELINAYNAVKVEMEKRIYEEFEAVKQKAIDAELAIQKELSDALIINEEDKLNRLKELDQRYRDSELSPLEQLQADAEAELAIQKELLDALIINEEEYLSRKKAIDDNLAMAEANMAEERIDRERSVNEQKVALTLSSLSAIGDLITAFGSDSEAAQKRAFDINKAVSLASAIANTALAVTAALASDGIPGVPGSRFIAAAAAGVAGAAQIATIAKTQFKGTSPTVTKPTAPGMNQSGPTGSGDPGRSGPDVNFYENEDNGNNVNASGVTTVVISEVAITDIQKRNANYSEIAQL